jgi:branched-chain amino acid transport system substrate-binding protein
MNKRLFLRTAAISLAVLGTLGAVPAAHAQTKPFKIGMILPMTGPFASTGRVQLAGAKAFIDMNGDTVAGRKIEFIVKDDAGMAANSKKIAQEMIVNDKVDAIWGFGLTPIAMAVAPVAAASKTPMIVTAAQTQTITDASPTIVRTSGTITQITSGVAVWAAKNGIKRAVVLIPDYAPGYEASEAFKRIFLAAGGSEVMEEIRVPVANPDFAPFLQRVLDLKPDALFVMLPAGPGAALMRQYKQRGLPEAGIRLIGHGGIADDDVLPQAGEGALGVVTSDNYANAHDSALNRKFTATYKKFDPTSRANFFAVAGYDGVQIVYEALKATNGKAAGQELVDAMKGLTFESPRGMVTVDPKYRDFIQDIYLRKIEMKDGELHNVEFDVVKRVNAVGQTGQ